MVEPFRPMVFVVSDGRGETCQHVIDAALVQFRGHHCESVRCARVRTVQQVVEVVARAAEAHGIIFYTLVSAETRRAMDLAARDHFVPAVDILGPALLALNDLFRSAPEATPGLLYETNREQFDRFDAIQYTLKHDDGQRPHELADADVVLVGVSRSSKSATCFYLAYAGVRAANVPLLPDIPPPPELLALPTSKVIGLRINAMRLKVVREARLDSMGTGWIEPYVDKREIARELIQANRWMETRHWRSIDISYRAVEETASRVMEMRGLKKLRRHDE